MKIMHLADLHIGRSILFQSLIQDQKYILNQIKDIIIKNSVDVVLICGDVYDKSIPGVEAVNLFSDFLTELYKLRVRVLIISGNHDSKDRLSFGNELFIDNGIYIEATYKGRLRKITFNDEFGNINFYMLPFIKPADVREYYSCDIDNYNDMIKAIMSDVNININERNIIMLHQFVTANGVDVIRSDSEILSLGGIDNIDVSNFYKFDYVAMGHIHRPQKLIRDTIRYAGSPLKYSFSEVNYNKSIPIINFRAKNDISIDFVELEPVRDMRIIKGPIDKLLDKDITCLGNKDDYINAIITDNDYVIDAIGKLRSIYKNILKIDYCNDRTIDNKTIDNITEDINNKSVLELFKDFYKLQNNIDLDDKKCKLITGIIDKMHNDN